MRVLVTGNLGYVGTVLTPLLKAAGHTVAGLDIDLYRDCSFPPRARLPSVPTRSKDIRDVESADLDGFDAAIHLAGLANEPLGEIDADVTIAINHQATVRLAECARRAGVRRFLFASSCSIYGAAGADIVDENAIPAPLTAYARSKLAAERDLARLARLAFEPISLRCGTVYGASPRLRFDLVVNNLTAWASATGQILLKSDGSAWRPLVHVEDVGRTYVAFLEASGVTRAGNVVNIGVDGENWRVRDVAALVAKSVPGSAVALAAAGAERDRRSYRVDFSRMKRVLPDFAPSWTVRRGVNQLAALLAAYPAGPEAFEGVAYQRRAHLVERMATGDLASDLRPMAPAV